MTTSAVPPRAARAPARGGPAPAAGRPGPSRRGFGRAALALALAPWAAPGGVRPAQAQPGEPAEAVRLHALEVRRDAEAVSVDFNVRLQLPEPVEDALRRGIALHFRAEATLLRPRWYWRAERVARARRQWRLSYQPLTGSFRVSVGALHQSFASLDAALLPITRMTRWRIAEAAEVAAGVRHVLEFDWRLDTGELPRPLQIGLGHLPEWQLAVAHSVELAR